MAVGMIATRIAFAREHFRRLGGMAGGFERSPVHEEDFAFILLDPAEPIPQRERGGGK
jgi:hypothetical protein